MRSRTRAAALASLAVALLVGSGCTTPARRTLGVEQLHARRDSYLQAYDADLRRISSASETRIQQEYAAEAERSGDEQVFDILVLSGGDAFGAFGAGFLEGWGQVSEAGFTRPRFDQISGVSGGALIAPFAFLGTPEAFETLTAIYAAPGPDWVHPRRRAGSPARFDVSQLHAQIRSAITPGLIEAIADGAREQRQLLIGATNADYGLLRVWDLGAIASEEAPELAAGRTVEILQAASAFPGAFPPILIDEFLYVDGGAAMQLVAGIEERGWLEASSTSPLDFVRPDQPVRLRVWMIVNQKLLPDATVVRSGWTAIGARSLNTLMRTSTLQAVRDAETYVRAIDDHPSFEAEFRYVAIPAEFPVPDPDAVFDAPTMRALVELGRELGADPASWSTRALRPGAPFQLTR